MALPKYTFGNPENANNLSGAFLHLQRILENYNKHLDITGIDGNEMFVHFYKAQPSGYYQRTAGVTPGITPLFCITDSNTSFSFTLHYGINSIGQTVQSEILADGWEVL